MSERPLVGIVDLRDLVFARPWERRYTRELVDALGLSLDWQSFTERTPCAAMLVVVQRFAPVRTGAWLKNVRDVVVVVDERVAAREGTKGIAAIDSSSTSTSTSDDAELRAIDDAEIAQALGTAPSLVLDGTSDAVDRVRAALADLAHRATRERASPTAASVRAETFDGPSGPWLDVAVSSWNAPRIHSRVTMLRGRVVVVEDGDTAGVPPRGGAAQARVLDLATALHVPHEAAHAHANTAFSRDGRFALRRQEQTLELVRVGRASALGAVDEHGLPFAIDVDAGLAAAGWRCTFTWLSISEHGGGHEDTLAVLGSCAHDWPVGHAKKLYRYDDNHPRHLVIAPDRGAYVSTFERDAIVSGAVPYRWTALRGSSAAGFTAATCALDWPPPDSLRKLFFVADLEIAAAHAGLPVPALDDPAARANVALLEDARHHAPIVVVGPSDDHRYALALDEEVWTIAPHDTAEDEACIVGGPHEGYAIFDAMHRVVRRGRGRLLGGDHVALLVLGEASDEHHEKQACTLWREELVSGARTPLGREDVAVAEAIAIAGRFVLVARRDDDDRAAMRLRLL